MSPLADTPTIFAPFAGYAGGFSELVERPNPAAGADFAEVLDSRYLTRLRSLHCKFVTTADVADRQVVLEYRTDQGRRFALHGAATVVTASSTVYYEFNAEQYVAEFTVDSSALIPLSGMWLPGGYNFRVHLVNANALDQLSEIRFWADRLYTDEVR